MKYFKCEDCISTCCKIEVNKLVFPEWCPDDVTRCGWVEITKEEFIKEVKDEK